MLPIPFGQIAAVTEPEPFTVRLALAGGTGMNSRGPWPQATRSAQRPMAVRPDVTRGLPTPATEDLSALAVTGESPTVLAFVLAQGPGGVA